MSGTKAFSVIVPTCHRNELLTRCLERLTPGAQTLAAAQYEVIVTDDGSARNAERLVRESFPWAHWQPGPRRGPAANRNSGARAASGEWLVFVDDDCVPDGNWLEAYAAGLRNHPGTQVFEGKVYADRPRRSLAEASPTNYSGGHLWSCNLAVKKSLFDRLKGFEERFPFAAMEDVDFSLRVRQAGQEPAFLEQAAVCHPWRPKGGWSTFQKHREALWIYLSLHPEESSRLNSRYYFMFALRSFVKQTLPGIFRYRAAGLTNALLEHLVVLQMAVALLFRPRLRPRSKAS